MKMISAVNKDNFWVKQIFILSFIALEVLLISIFVQSTITFSLSIIIILAVFIGLEYLVFVKKILEEIWIDTTTKNNIISAVVSSFVCLFLVIYAFISNIFGLILPSCIVIGVIAFFALFILIRKIVTLYESESKYDGSILNKHNFWVKQIFILSVIALTVLLTSIFVQSTITFSLSIIIIISLFIGLEYLVFVKKILEEIWIDTTTKNNIISVVVSFLVCLFLVIYAFVLNISRLSLSSCILLGIIAFFALYVVVKNIVRIEDIKLDIFTIILALLSALWVFIPLLSSYSANIAEIDAKFVVTFGVFCAVGTIIIYSLLLLFFKSALSAFGGCVILWICMSASYSIITSVNESLGISFEPIYTILMILLIITVCFGVKILECNFKPNLKKIIILLYVLVVVLIVVSLIPIISYNVESGIIESEYSSSETSYVIDPSLPKPNIYWIHAESMMNENSLEKYFGNETVGLTKKLEDDGFYVNQNAEIIGALATVYSLPALMCPNYYDIYENYYLNESADDEWNIITDISSITTITQNTYRKNNELIDSFKLSDYETIGILGWIEYDLSSFEKLYIDKLGLTYDGNIIAQKISNPNGELDFVKYTAYPVYYIITIFDSDSQYTKYIINSITDKESFTKITDDNLNKLYYKYIVTESEWYEEYKQYINFISYSLDNDSSPKLTVIYPGMLAHYYDRGDYYKYDEYGNHQENKFEYDVSGYYEQYLFSEKIILNIVDTIQQKDPNSIIIIQGDHGLHSTIWTPDVKKYVDTLNVDADYRELKYHVLSAVYIPEQYRTEGYEEILSNPLNIARYLVNNFVGQNYEYK